MDLNLAIDILENTKFTPEIRIQSAFHLLSNPSEKSISALKFGLFYDPNAIVRHECAYSLGEINNPQCSSILITAIENDENPFVIHEAALALGNLGTPKSRSTLEKLLLSNNPDIVDTAQISLDRLDMKISKISKKFSKNTVLDLMTKPENRIQAAFQLLESNQPEDVHLLIKALHQETNPIVKHEIIFCLGETASQSVIDHLVAQLDNDQNPFVVHETLLALATLGDAKAIPIIKKFISNLNEDIADSAKIALERINN